MTISFLCRVAGDIEWHPVTSPAYEKKEFLVDWLLGFMNGPNPISIKEMRMW